MQLYCYTYLLLMKEDKKPDAWVEVFELEFILL